MITTILSILILALFALFLIWWLMRSAAACVERAICATGQALALDTRPGESLTEEQRETAQVMAAKMARDLLGRWRALFLRIVLGRWDLSGWLCAEIESAVARLKTANVLPMSVKAAKARNPFAGWAEQLVHAFVPAYTAHKSGPGSNGTGSHFGSTPQA